MDFGGLLSRIGFTLFRANAASSQSFAKTGIQSSRPIASASVLLPVPGKPEKTISFIFHSMSYMTKSPFRVETYPCIVTFSQRRFYEKQNSGHFIWMCHLDGSRRHPDRK